MQPLLADDFSLISGEIVGISEGDSTFYTAPAERAVAQSVTATFSLADVTATFFKVVIGFPIPGGQEGSWEDTDSGLEE